MPTFLAKPSVSLFLLLILLSTATPSCSFSFFFSHYRIILSLSHSLASRVANLRASRGDLSGASRAESVAQKIESLQGLGFWKLTRTLGWAWDYLRNDAWRDIDAVSFADLSSTVSDLNELLRALNELSRVNSDSGRVAWVGRNYNRILTISRSLFVSLLKIFRQSGPLRELVETMQKEVVDGDLLRDCLELGSNDLKGLIQVLKDIAVQYTDSASRGTEL